MTRIIRHEGHPREGNGAVVWRKLLPMFHRDHPEVKKWTKQVWLVCLEKYILYKRAIQNHSGGTKVDPSLQDNEKIPYKWIDFIYHVGSSHDCIRSIRSCLIAGGKDPTEGRQTVFFTAVIPMNEQQTDESYDVNHDVNQPREVPYPNEVESVPEYS